MPGRPHVACDEGPCREAREGKRWLIRLNHTNRDRETAADLARELMEFEL